MNKLPFSRKQPIIQKQSNRPFSHPNPILPMPVDAVEQANHLSVDEIDHLTNVLLAYRNAKLLNLQIEQLYIRHFGPEQGFVIGIIGKYKLSGQDKMIEFTPLHNSAYQKQKTSNNLINTTFMPYRIGRIYLLPADSVELFTP